MISGEFVRKVKHALRLLALWYLIALVSLVAMFAVAQIPRSQRLDGAVEAGVRDIESTTKIIQNISDNNLRHDDGYQPLDENRNQDRPMLPAKARTVILTSLVLFSKNLRPLIILLAPFFGSIFYGIMIVYNGLLGRTLAEMMFGSRWQLALFTVLFLYPHSYLEFLSYSIAVHSSTILGFQLVKDRKSWKPFEVYWKRALISIGCLYLAAVVEALLIVG